MDFANKSKLEEVPQVTKNENHHFHVSLNENTKILPTIKNILH